MFVKFVKELPSLPHKVGDVAEFPDQIGRSYVDGGYGAEVSIAEHLQARQAAAFTDLKAEMARAVQDAFKGTPAPPATPPGVEFSGEVRGGSTPAERDKAIGLGEITRCMYWRRAFGDDERVSESMARYAKEKLDHVWRLQRTTWTDNSEAHVSRDNPNGVARDGSGQGAGGAPTYGYLVRPEFLGEVFKIEAETDVMTGLRQIPVGSGIEVHMPALDQYNTTTSNRTSNYFAGVTLYRKAEDAARAAVDAKTADIEFKITDLTALTKVSRDLMVDSFVDINGFLQGLFRDAFGWRRDWDFLNGTGAGEPTGIFGAGCEINGGPNSNARTTASHIRYEDVAWMMSKLLPQARRGAYWIVNAQAGVDLQSILAASPSAFAFQPNAVVTQSQYPSIYGTAAFDGMLLGLPIKYTEKVPALGTARDITLFNPQYYGEAQKSGLEVAISDQRYFENDQVGIRWKLRNDGKPMMRSYFTGADGNTYSPIVTLK